METINRLTDAFEFPTLAEELATFATCDPIARPPRLLRTAYDALPASEQELYDEWRLARFVYFGAAPTPPVSDDCRQALNRLLRINCRKGPGARVNVALTGEPNSGKTTLALQLAVETWRKAMAAYDGREPLTAERAPFCPVVTVTLLHDMSPWDMAVLLANFLNVNLRGMRTHGQATTAIATALRRCDARLILIDELSALKNTRERNRVVQEMLKSFQNVLRATFLIAGYNLIENGLLSEGQGTSGGAELSALTKRRRGRHPHNTTQTGMRFTPFTLDAYPAESSEDARRWYKLLELFEVELVLLDQAPGRWLTDSSTGLASYVHTRTGGLIGLVANLLEQAYTEVLGSDCERIDRELLETIILPVAAPFGGLPLGRLKNTTSEDVRDRPDTDPETAIPADQFATMLKTYEGPKTRKGRRSAKAAGQH